METLAAKENILLAYRNIKRNKGSKISGSDGKIIKDFESLSQHKRVEKIKKAFATYHPGAVRTVFIPKDNGKKCRLGIPNFIDRLCQQCVKQVLEPIAEAKFHKHNYGFRPLRSVSHAIAYSGHMIN